MDTSLLRRSLAPALVVLCLGCGDEPYPATGELSLADFDSAAVGDRYKLRVRLPPDYDEAAVYPLVVQLDPTFARLEQYDITVGLVSHHAAAGDWPEAAASRTRTRRSSCSPSSTSAA